MIAKITDRITGELSKILLVDDGKNISHEEAKVWIEEKLKGWMNPTDRIVWDTPYLAYIVCADEQVVDFIGVIE